MLEPSLKYQLVNHSRSNPYPSFKLWLVSADNQNKELLSSSTSLQNLDMAEVENFELTKADDGKYFFCEAIQTEADSGETFFRNFVTSDPIRVVYPPMLNVVSHPPYIFVNRSLLIEVPFAAKPGPQNDQYTWTIRPTFTDADGTGNDEQRLQNEETEMFAAFGIETTTDGNDFVARLKIKNLTDSVDVTLAVWNDYGEMKHSFIVNFVPPLPPPDESVDERATEAGIALWLIIVVNIFMLSSCRLKIFPLALLHFRKFVFE